jgi:uncharacterized Zn-finger protein
MSTYEEEQDQEIFKEEFIDIQDEEILENEEEVSGEDFHTTDQYVIVSEENVEVLDEFAADIIEYEEGAVTSEELIEDVKTRSRGQSSGTSHKHKCEYCDSSYPNKKRLQNHIQVNHVQFSDADLLQCRMCGKRFKLQSYLETHIRNIHTDNPMNHRRHVKCSQCGKVLKSTIALRNHEALHTAHSIQMPDEVFKRFQCDKCGLRFRLKSYIFNHIHNVHLKNKYKCDICQLGFYKRYELEDHYRVHTNERPITCEFEGCGKTFARLKNYKIHQVRSALFDLF